MEKNESGDVDLEIKWSHEKRTQLAAKIIAKRRNKIDGDKGIRDEKALLEDLDRVLALLTRPTNFLENNISHFPEMQEE